MSRSATRTVGIIVVLTCLLAGLSGLLASCSASSATDRHTTAANAHAAAVADTTLPPLNGQYLYAEVSVAAKNLNSQSFEGTVQTWGVDGKFARSPLSAGQTGTISTRDLTVPSSVDLLKNGATVIVAYPADSSNAFPITAHSIESVSGFTHRVAADKA